MSRSHPRSPRPQRWHPHRGLPPPFSRMRTEGHPEAPRHRPVRNSRLRLPPDDMIAEEPDVMPVAFQGRLPQRPGPPPESRGESAEDDGDPVPRRSPPSTAASRQRFRRFRYEDAASPREVLARLQELAEGWLRPDVNTKEQIVEMLVQEQFQAVLPEELRDLARRCQPGVRITG